MPGRVRPAGTTWSIGAMATMSASAPAMVGDRAGRAQVGAGEERTCRLVDPAAGEVVEGVAERHGEMQHDRGIAIAVGGAGGAAVADEVGPLEVPDRAHLLVPGLA